MTQTQDRRKRVSVDLPALVGTARDLRDSVQQFKGHADARAVLLAIGNGLHPGADMGKDQQGRRWFSMAGPLPAAERLRPPAVYTLDGAEFTIERYQLASERGECWALIQWAGPLAPDAHDMYRGKPVRRKRLPVIVQRVD